VEPCPACPRCRLFRRHFEKSQVAVDQLAECNADFASKDAHVIARSVLLYYRDLLVGSAHVALQAGKSVL
jgi:hypothetical protein